jgi:membrane-associated phospholipid phosphatase
VNLFAAATVIVHHFRRTGIFALGIAAFVSLSRVYIGVHYPGDIVGGAVLGVAIGFGVMRAARFVARRRRGTGAPTDGPPDRSAGWTRAPGVRPESSLGFVAEGGDSTTPRAR